MMAGQFSRYEGALMEAAPILSASSSIPVNVSQLCKCLGVEIRRAKTGRAHALLVDWKLAPKIFLPFQEAHKAEYTAWERFLIAHELGHLVLNRANVPNPDGAGEYWQLESLCDSFARRLLIPDLIFRPLYKRLEKTPIQALNFSRYIERTAMVTWPAAALRLADWNPDIFLLRCLVDTTERSGRVNFSTLPNRREQGRMLTKGALAAFSGIPIQKPVSASPPELGSWIPSIKSARLAALARISASEIRVAAVE